MGDNPRDRVLVTLARDRGEALTRYALYRWDGGPELREIARGIAAIAW